jgi:putative oxidoreductase
MRNLFLKLSDLHERLFQLVSNAQTPFLLVVRLYWGWQLAQSGWGKLHNLDKVAEFFTSLNLPFPAQMAVFIACVEFFGGIFFALGLFSRMSALVLTVNMLMAYIIADREAFFSFFSDPDKFSAAAPYVFLFASILVLTFGPGKLCIDELFRRFAHIPRTAERAPYVTSTLNKKSSQKSCCLDIWPVTY